MARNIKTREKVKGIKTLDRAAVASQRMKNAYVRTKDQAGRLTEDSHDSGTDYAQNQVQYAAEDVTLGTSHAAAAGARLAVNKTKQTIRERKEIKTAERYNAAPQPYYDAPNSPNTIRGTSPLDTMAAGGRDDTLITTACPSGQAPRQRRPIRPANLQYTMAQVRAREEACRKGIVEFPEPEPTEPYSHPSSRIRAPTQEAVSIDSVTPQGNPVERGRQLAVSKAKQSAAKRQKIKQREQYAPKTRNVRPQARNRLGSEYTSTAQNMQSQAKGRFTESMAHRAVIKQDRSQANQRRNKIDLRRRTPAWPAKQRTPAKVNRQEAYTPAYRTTRRPFQSSATQTASRARETPVESGSSLKHVRVAEQTVKSKAKAIGRDTIKTASRSIKITGRTVKTAEQTSTAAVTTARQSAVATKKATAASAQAAKKAAAAAKFAAEKAAQAARAAARATAHAIKAIIAAMEELISAIIAGGSAAALVIIVVCLLGLIVASCFGIFFSGEDTGTGMTMNQVIREINEEYQAKVEEIKAANPHDELVISGSKAIWKEVLAVYAVKTTSDRDNPMEVASVTEEKKELLRDIFWSMTVIDYYTETVTTTEEVETEDEEGNPVTEEVEVQTVYLYITTQGKTADEMAAEYGFDAKQTDQLHELLSSEYDGLWTAVLYGVGASDEGIVNVALSQLGNVGGQPYWSWYGFGSRVAWCACFVSWCADQCGYIEAGIIPKFSLCDDGIYWFKARSQWAGNDVEPSPGWIIFFDWDLDGYSDHVGIVEYCEGGYVHTVEGNTSGDICKQNMYVVGESDVMGYGMPAY